MAKKNILFINGIADDGKVKIASIDKNNVMHFQVSGSSNIASFLDPNYITSYKSTFDLDPKQELNAKPNIHAVFNEISDADTHKITLAKAEILYNVFSEKLPFFNIPANIRKTTRDNIYKLLHDIDKLHVPKTVKIRPKSSSDIYDVIAKEKFEFPVIFRQAGDHGGISTIRIDDKTEQFYPFPLDGREYYLTQFVDYKENDLYIKYRLIIIGGEVFIRSVMPGNQWLVHHATRLSNDEGQTIEKNILKNFSKEIAPAIQPTITEIYNRLNLDYFGIDCHISENKKMLIFEVNANMDVFSDSSQIQTGYTKKIREALVNLIINKTV